MAPALTGAAIEGSTAIGRLPSTATEGTWYYRRNCPGRSRFAFDMAPTLIGAAIEAAPIEACRKADGLRFVLDVT
jgi:hypothetical protein